LEGIAKELQPKVQQAIDRGGVGLRNVLDGVWFEVSWVESVSVSDVSEKLATEPPNVSKGALC
jgi:hypothetical protein